MDVTILKITLKYLINKQKIYYQLTNDWDVETDAKIVELVEVVMDLHKKHMTDMGGNYENL